MPTEIILPRVDMDMETGKIGKWYVVEGGRVEKGKLLFELETNKAAMEIDAAATGTLRDVTAKPGDELAVGTVIGRIFAEGEAYTTPAKGAATAGASVPQATPHPVPLPKGEGTQAAGHVAQSGGLRATPKARRIAKAKGIDIARVAGSGPRGRIQARDVEQAPASAAALAAANTGAGLLNCEWLARGNGWPLVLLHGFGADLNSWRPLLSHLSAGRSVLAIDLPGHGKSAYAGETSIDALAEAVAATVASEGALSGLHLIAHSLGGAVAVALAAHPGVTVRSLTLIAPAGLGPDINGAFLAGFLRAESEAALAPWTNQLAADPAALGPALVKTTLRQRRDMGGAAGQAAIAAALFPDGTQTFSTRAALAKFNGVAKLIFGLSDQIIPASHARGLPGMIGLHLFPGIGHMPQLEARREVARLIAEAVAAAERMA